MVDRQWQLKFTKLAQKDAKRLAAAGLKLKTQKLLEILIIKLIIYWLSHL